MKGEQERERRKREDKRKEDKGEATRTRGGHRARSPDPAQVQLAAALTKGEGRLAPESRPRVPRASDPASRSVACILIRFELPGCYDLGVFAFGSVGVWFWAPITRFERWAVGFVLYRSVRIGNC